MTRFHNLINQRKNKEIVIAEDINQYGSKFFKIVKYDDINELLKYDKNSYETIVAKIPVKLYFDYEFINDNPINTLKKHIQSVIKIIKKELNKEVKEPIILYGGYKEDKKEHSFHVIYEDCIFENNKHLKLFISILINKEKIFYKNIKGISKPLYDICVYSNNRFMRMVNQSKMCQNRRLELKEHIELNRTLIGIYDGSSGYIKIEEEEYIKKTKSKHKAQLKDVVGYNKNIFHNNFFNGLVGIPKKKNRKLKILKDINEVLDYIPNDINNKQKYFQWFLIGCLCNKFGIKKEKFRAWTGEEIKIKYEDIEIEIVNNIQNDNFLITIANLYYEVVDIRNIDEFYTTIKPDITYVNKFVKPLIKYDTGSITDYLNVDDNIINYNDIEKRKTNTTFIVKSGLGTGKTYQIISNINSGKYKSCIILTPRITFAENLVKELNRKTDKDFCLYRNLHDNDDFVNCDWLVIQQESLYKIIENETSFIKKYELVAIDEVESIQTQMTSDMTNKNNMLDNINVFRHILVNSKVNILCDGFITNRTIKMCEDLNIEYKFIENTYINDGKIAIQLFKDENISLENITKFLESEVIGKNKKIYCVITKRKYVENFNTKMFEKVGKRCKIYHGNLTDTEKKINDVNKEWVEYDLIITTTTISVGIDFTANHFDYGFVYGDFRCGLVRDSFQALFRVRKIRKIYYCYNVVITSQKKITMMNFINNNNKTIAMTKKYLETYKPILNKSNIISIDIKLRFFDDFSRRILMFNLMEEAINRRLYSFIFQHYLKICGYKTEEPILKQKTCKENFNKSYKYDEYEDLSKEEFTRLQKLKNNGNLKEEQKIQVSKHIFKELFNEEILAKEIIDDVFSNYINDYKTLTNFYNEFNKKHTNIFTNVVDRVVDVNSKVYKQFEILNHVKETLKIKHTTKNFSITETELIKHKNMFNEYKGDIKLLYGYKIPDIITKNNMKTTINKIITGWSNGNIKFIGERINTTNKTYVYKLEIPKIYLNITNAFKDKSIIKKPE